MCIGEAELSFVLWRRRAGGLLVGGGGRGPGRARRVLPLSPALLLALLASEAVAGGRLLELAGRVGGGDGVAAGSRVQEVVRGLIKSKNILNIKLF